MPAPRDIALRISYDNKRLKAVLELPDSRVKGFMALDKDRLYGLINDFEDCLKEINGTDRFRSFMICLSSETIPPNILAALREADDEQSAAPAVLSLWIGESGNTDVHGLPWECVLLDPDAPGDGSNTLGRKFRAIRRCKNENAPNRSVGSTLSMHFFHEFANKSQIYLDTLGVSQTGSTLSMANGWKVTVPDVSDDPRETFRVSLSVSAVVTLLSHGSETATHPRIEINARRNLIDRSDYLRNRRDSLFYASGTPPVMIADCCWSAYTGRDYSIWQACANNGTRVFAGCLRKTQLYTYKSSNVGTWFGWRLTTGLLADGETLGEALLGVRNGADGLSVQNYAGVVYAIPCVRLDETVDDLIKKHEDQKKWQWFNTVNTLLSGLMGGGLGYLAGTFLIHGRVLPDDIFSRVQGAIFGAATGAAIYILGLIGSNRMKKRRARRQDDRSE